MAMDSAWVVAIVLALLAATLDAADVTPKTGAEVGVTASSASAAASTSSSASASPQLPQRRGARASVRDLYYNPTAAPAAPPAPAGTPQALTGTAPSQTATRTDFAAPAAQQQDYNQQPLSIEQQNYIYQQNYMKSVRQPENQPHHLQQQQQGDVGLAFSSVSSFNNELLPSQTSTEQADASTTTAAATVGRYQEQNLQHHHRDVSQTGAPAATPSVPRPTTDTGDRANASATPSITGFAGGPIVVANLPPGSNDILATAEQRSAFGPRAETTAYTAAPAAGYSATSPSTFTPAPASPSTASPAPLQTASAASFSPSSPAPHSYPLQSQPQQSQPSCSQQNQNQPQQSYSPQSYPQQIQNQPQQNYPQQNYPQQSYPQQNQAQQNYPQQNQPQQSYPQQNQAQQNYFQPGQLQSQQSYSQQNYQQPGQPQQNQPQQSYSQIQTQQHQPQQSNPQQNLPQQSYTQQVQQDQPLQSFAQQIQPQEPLPQQSYPQQSQPTQSYNSPPLPHLAQQPILDQPPQQSTYSSTPLPPSTPSYANQGAFSATPGVTSQDSSGATAASFATPVETAGASSLGFQPFVPSTPSPFTPVSSPQQWSPALPSPRALPSPGPGSTGFSSGLGTGLGSGPGTYWFSPPSGVGDYNVAFHFDGASNDLSGSSRTSSKAAQRRGIPRTSFGCRGKKPGYYADLETGCQVFHICQHAGLKSSFMCPEGSIFNQQLLVCDWWFDTVCEAPAQSQAAPVDTAASTTVTAPPPSTTLPPPPPPSTYPTTTRQPEDLADLARGASAYQRRPGGIIGNLQPNEINVGLSTPSPSLADPIFENMRLLLSAANAELKAAAAAQSGLGHQVNALAGGQWAPAAPVGTTPLPPLPSPFAAAANTSQPTERSTWAGTDGATLRTGFSLPPQEFRTAPPDERLSALASNYYPPQPDPAQFLAQYQTTQPPPPQFQPFPRQQQPADYSAGPAASSTATSHQQTAGAFPDDGLFSQQVAELAAFSKHVSQQVENTLEVNLLPPFEDAARGPPSVPAPASPLGYAVTPGYSSISTNRPFLAAANTSSASSPTDSADSNSTPFSGGDNALPTAVSEYKASEILLAHVQAAKEVYDTTVRAEMNATLSSTAESSSSSAPAQPAAPAAAVASTPTTLELEPPSTESPINLDRYNGRQIPFGVRIRNLKRRHRGH